MKRLLLVTLLAGGNLLAQAADRPFALQFDGANDYVAIPHSSAFNTHQLTVAAWIRTTQLSGEAGLINKYVANSLNGWNVFLFNGQLRAFYIRDNVNRLWDGGRGMNAGFVADGQWHHIALTVNALEARLYVDGLPWDARFWDGAAGNVTTTQELRLGSYPGIGFYNGLMDEVSVWSRSLTGAEIATLRSNSLTGAEANLEGYYRLAEGTGTTALNSGRLGFLFDGALINGPLWVTGVTLKPAAATFPASAVASSSAALNGAASPGGTNAAGWFEWGTTTNYGNLTAPQSLGAGDNSTNFSQELTGLNLAATVHFRAAVSNRFGVAFGANQTFRTLGASVETLPATSLTQSSATFNALTVPGGADTVGWFEFGFTTNYDSVTPAQPLGGGSAPTNFSEELTGLIPHASYHFRAVASNSFGVVFGADQSFPRFSLNAYIKASNTGQSDRFGEAVAMSGDTLVIGAPGESSNATGVNGNQNNNNAGASGAAYVLLRTGGTWVQQAYLKASNTDFADFFGQAVSISGDTIVIGAASEDSNATGVNGTQSNNTGTNSGAAYVFVRTGTNWSQQAYLKASNTAPGDLFGAAVGISGDTIVIGAPNEDSGAPGVNGNQNDNSEANSGAAYVFVRNGTNWTQQAYLKASNPDGTPEPFFGDFFGTSVAVSGDTIAVGAPIESSNATGINGDQNNNFASGSGAAYVFVRNATTWTQQAYIKASNTGPSDNFGDSLALAGDTLVVNAEGEDSNATGVNGSQTNNVASSAGAAYVFVRNGAIWSQQAYLKASNAETNDLFGSSAAVHGDTIVVGARVEDSNARGVNGDGGNNLASSSGAAYRFVRSGSTWTFQDYFKASNTESNDVFGKAVAVSGDIVIAGATAEASNAIGINGDQDNNSALSSGAVYAFGPPLPPAPEITVSQVGTNILDGGSAQQYLVGGTNNQTRFFTIRNTGNLPLTGLAVRFVGPEAAMFAVGLNPAPSVPPTSNTTFSVRFAPTSTGTKTATLQIASNDGDENPFNILLTGVSLSFTEDLDGDGLNDASELLMAPLGFNFQVPQTGLVTTLFNNANGAGLFTPSQLQALSPRLPLLTRDPFTGQFTLTIGLEKSTDLINFLPYPITPAQTTINAEGELEFRFTSPDNAAFYRLEAR